VANAHGGQAQAHARPDGGLDVQITLPATPNGYSPTPHQPQTTTPPTWQPDHRIPPATDQGHATAGQKPNPDTRQPRCQHVHERESAAHNHVAKSG
jgi:hypothetical protein